MTELDDLPLDMTRLILSPAILGDLMAGERRIWLTSPDQRACYYFHSNIVTLARLRLVSKRIGTAVDVHGYPLLSILPVFTYSGGQEVAAWHRISDTLFSVMQDCPEHSLFSNVEWLQKPHECRERKHVLRMGNHYPPPSLLQQHSNQRHVDILVRDLLVRREADKIIALDRLWFDGPVDTRAIPILPYSFLLALKLGIDEPRCFYETRLFKEAPACRLDLSETDLNLMIRARASKTLAYIAQHGEVPPNQNREEALLRFYNRLLNAAVSLHNITSTIHFYCDPGIGKRSIVRRSPSCKSLALIRRFEDDRIKLRKRRRDWSDVEVGEAGPPQKIARTILSYFSPSST